MRGCENMHLWLKLRLEPCFQRWVQLLVSAVTALRSLERFSARPQAPESQAL